MLKAQFSFYLYLLRKDLYIVWASGIHYVLNNKNMFYI